MQRCLAIAVSCPDGQLHNSRSVTPSGASPKGELAIAPAFLRDASTAPCFLQLPPVRWRIRDERPLPTAGHTAVVCGQMLGLNKWRGQSVGAPHYSDSILPVHSAGVERLLVMLFLSVADRSPRRHRKELRSNMRNDRIPPENFCRPFESRIRKFWHGVQLKVF